MTAGKKPEAHPDKSPVISAFKANFVHGGLLFNMHHHHYGYRYRRGVQLTSAQLELLTAGNS
ncbi:hypothetical protein F4820DRAFT_403513, partial [Hypoxylon rubiginosum]